LAEGTKIAANRRRRQRESLMRPILGYVLIVALIVTIELTWYEAYVHTDFSQRSSFSKKMDSGAQKHPNN
jgi:hypothetical protein